MEQRKKCKNCVYFIKETKKGGNCSELKELTGYRFSYKEEKTNLYPRVSQYCVCDYHEFKI